jgi:hypothetical protein
MAGKVNAYRRLCLRFDYGDDYFVPMLRTDYSDKNKITEIKDRLQRSQSVIARIRHMFDGNDARPVKYDRSFCERIKMEQSCYGRLLWWYSAAI